MREFLSWNKFVPFGVFLAPKVAGWHDGQKSHIKYEFLSTDAVFYHEQAHETVFLNTADGLLLSVLFRVLNSGRSIDVKVIRRLKVTADVMFETSHRAHEIAATYIGLKMLTPSDALVAEQSLPLAYRKYYDAASKVIDKNFGSTFFQMVVFSTVAHFAFGSTFLEAFVTQSWPRYKKLKPEYQPNYRLDKILRYLASGKIIELREVLDATADTFFETKKIERWNLDSEDDWPSGKVEGHLLDRALAQSAKSWLEQQNFFPSLTGERKKYALVRLGSLCEKLGFSYKIRDSTPGKNQNVDPILPMDIKGFIDVFTDDDSIAAAERQAGSLVSNSQVLEIPRLPSQLLKLLLGLTGFQEVIVVGADPFNSIANWTILLRGPSVQHTTCIIGGLGYLGVQASYNDIREWLLAIEVGGWLGAEPTLFVLSAASTTDHDVNSNHSNLISSRWDDRTIFYPLRNWANFVDDAISLGNIETTQVVIKVREQDSMDDPTGEIILFLYLIRGEPIPAKCFIRPFNKNANTAMVLLHHKWEKQPTYRSLTTEEALSAGFDITSAATAFGCLMAFWSFF
ncbi:hypothetical protein [Pseudomonas sp.]|uniref:hypothetical protein n=1 Tax=Pseudomonas sp. TaxID=306 RepID=UPI003263A9B6